MFHFKLKSGVSHFYEPVSRLYMYPNKTYEIATIPQSRIFKDALMAGTVLRVTDPKAEEKVPPTPEELLQERKDTLLAKTKKEILADFDYMDPEDLEAAKGKPNKKETVDFLIEIESEYAD